MKWLSFLARRFVAGETAAEGIAAVRRMNAQGIQGILDFLGEDVETAEQARAAAEEYVALLRLIDQEKVGSGISLKASQMGLRLSPELCLENLRRVAAEAQARNCFLWMDMEGSALTQKTIEVFARLQQDYPRVGLCLQAYLVRTGGDLDRLMRGPGRLAVRLCKGAYREPPEIAFAGKPAVDGSFRMLALKLLDPPAGIDVFSAFATHDRRLIEFLVETIRQLKVPNDRFEFQMLYGIQNRLLLSLSRQGFQTRVYIPYGRAWLPYFTRRLRERKENFFFLLRNLFHV